jgi:hypothetical protein
MTYKIWVSFDVKRLKNEEDARAMGTAIAEHIADTFNDDNSIGPLYDTRVEKVKR